jgi:hypothetical protein
LLIFLILLAIGLRITCVSQRFSDDLKEITNLAALISLALSVFLAPWQLLLFLTMLLVANPKILQLLIKSAGIDDGPLR